ncbi:MAG: RNA polymerase factor sigma-54 [Firmicutes bacterium]|jgi:RNA polymerase sigma-54 factor|nr:RNA polymerase factor sigma-54 [Bacillota bacterium]
MRLDYELKLEQSQKLIITPELKLAINILQYSALELQDFIQEELLSNPVLEIGDGELEGEEEPPEQLPEDDFPWEEYFRDADLDLAGYMPNPARRDWSEFPSVDNYAGSPSTMMEELLGQLRLIDLTPRQYGIAAYIIGNLEPDGYLRADLHELAEALGVPLEEMEMGLKIVQGLEPPGIASRNLRECLLLQLQSLENPPPLAVKIVEQYLSSAAEGRYRQIAARLGCDVAEVQAAVDFIRTLNPRPGANFGGAADTRYIVPDIIVEKVDGEYVILMNDQVAPHLTISPFYQRLARSGVADEKLSNFIKSKLEKAAWLLRSIEQRRLTLYRVAQKIVEIQQPFLEHGIKHLKPLTLKDVARAVGVHESTVSRATANKYMQTPRGLYPLKFFFSSGLTGEGGEDYSSHSIKSYLRDLIEHEDPQNPFSDQQLTELLEAKGIFISRRTVAKYREELSIPASYRRRRH